MSARFRFAHLELDSTDHATEPRRCAGRSTMSAQVEMASASAVLELQLRNVGGPWLAPSPAVELGPGDDSVRGVPLGGADEFRWKVKTADPGQKALIVGRND